MRSDAGIFQRRYYKALKSFFVFPKNAKIRNFNLGTPYQLDKRFSMAVSPFS